MDKFFDLVDQRPGLFFLGVIVIDLLVFFGLVAGAALIVKAVFF